MIFIHVETVSVAQDLSLVSLSLAGESSIGRGRTISLAG